MKKCVTCKVEKEKSSFYKSYNLEGLDSTCKICRLAQAKRRKPPQKTHNLKMSTTLREATRKSIIKSNNELFKRGIQNLKKRGFITTVEASQEITKISLSCGYLVKIKIRADGVGIEYQSEAFKTKEQLDEHIDSIFNNPKQIAERYLEEIA